MSIHETNTIDLITQRHDSDEVALIMVEGDGWKDIQKALMQVQLKLNAYLAYALDGQLVADYPDLKNKRIRIQLDTTSVPPIEVTRMIRKMEDACVAFGVTFIVNVLS
jgi:hypothetical protein